jgi:hypothetical protein
LESIRNPQVTGSRLVVGSREFVFPAFYAEGSRFESCRAGEPLPVPEERIASPVRSGRFEDIGLIVAPMPEFLRESVGFRRVRIPASRPNQNLQNPIHLA